MVQTLRSSPQNSAQVHKDVAAKAERRVVDLVSLLEWVYAEQKAHQELVADDEARHLTVRCSLERLENVLALGTFVDGGGRSGADLHPDAELVHRTVMDFARLSDDCAHAAGLVIYYASQMLQPEKPHVSGKRLIAERNPSGRVAMSYWKDGEELFVQPNTKLAKPYGYDGPGCRVGQACELAVISVESDLEEFLLETYTYWCAGLQMIAEAIPMLKTHKVKEFQMPEFDQSTTAKNFLKLDTCHDLEHLTA
ncbi:hypothetical protein ACMG4P_07445 [Pseudovibrio denitrificans]|uniref:hypothetical protein n=1 Tax=Pseudovibrio denitrificans TaxID=258256 RepID=UPI0039BF670B